MKGRKPHRDYNLSQEFRDLCMACRKGDVELVDKFITSGIELNQMDEWDYSPLILASICGHEDVVRLLLEKGCLVNRDTFEGSRAIYGALTEDIRNLLESYDIDKAVDVTQPFASHIAAMLTKPKFITADLLIEFKDSHIQVHRFMLQTMSEYFAKHLDEEMAGSRFSIDTGSEFKESSWRFLIDYLYLVPRMDLSKIDVEDLTRLAKKAQLPDLVLASERISRQKTMADKAKVKNQVQRQICEIARGKMKKLVEKLISVAEVKEEEDDLEPEEKLKLANYNGADVILRADLIDGRSIFYPVHQSVLNRGEYFDALFQSPFGDMKVFRDLELEDLQIIDRQALLEEPELIPVVSLPTTIASSEVMEILLGFLYYDRSDIPKNLAVDILMLADSLFIERLKTFAAIVITSIHDYEKEGISIYDILRIAWQTRMQRLETHVAQQISQELPRYLHDPSFKEIVKESAERIVSREEYDTIELIDDIKFYLREHYCVDEDDATLNPDLDNTSDRFKEETAEWMDTVMEWRKEYEEVVVQLDALVESLGLQLWVDEE